MKKRQRVRPRSGLYRAPPLVLVVDDSPDVRELYVACLHAAGFRTAQAENGMMALRSLQEIQPALVVLDYHMPVLDGLETARAIKGDPRTAAIPLILASSFTLEGEVPWFEHTLSKPCSPERLVQAVATSLAAAASA
ncbi:MAG TPA: response regulator [Polyangiaceae bacterium]